jgi:hypothetical protein
MSFRFKTVGHTRTWMPPDAFLTGYNPDVWCGIALVICLPGGFQGGGQQVEVVATAD